MHRSDVHPLDWIAGQARKCGALVDGPDSVIGIEGDSHFFSARGYLALVAGLPRARVIDSAELVNWVRLVKSDYEVQQLRIAGQIAQQAMQTALDSIRPGRRQCDVVAEILAAQVCGTTEHGGDYAALVPLLPTGGAAAGTPHLTWTDLPFVEGEATTVELAGVFGRYHAPLARTVMLGEPPPRLSRTATVVREAMSAALAALLPGATGDDVHAAFTAVLHRHELRKDSRIGYSIGIGYPPRLGRTDGQPARERGNGAGSGNGLPRHPRHVDGRLGL